MECVERGLLDAPWLRFGAGRLAAALQAIGHREGLGDWLAEGSRRLAERIGHESIAFAPQVKGLEMPGYEPRSLQTMALGLAVGTRADHNRSGAYEADFSDRVDRHRSGLSGRGCDRDGRSRGDSGFADPLQVPPRRASGFRRNGRDLRLITGWHVAAEEMRQTAQRIVTAKKLFNIQAGWRPARIRCPCGSPETLPNGGEAGFRAKIRSAIATVQPRPWLDGGRLVDPQRTARIGNGSMGAVFVYAQNEGGPTRTRHM